MNRIQIKSILMLVVAIILMVGCGKVTGSSNTKSKKDTSTDKIKVIATFYPMYEFTKQIAGDKADVQLLIPSTIEPHDWEPTPKDMANIQKADVFIFNSEYMESWVPSIRKSISNNNVDFVEASKGITLKKGVEEEEHEHDHDHGDHDHEGDTNAHDSSEEHEHHHHHEFDPHVWLSPVLAQQEVKTITEALIKADPKNKEEYEENSVAFTKKLKKLDSDFREGLKDIKQKEIVTQHAAFGYLTNEYGLIQVPIAGLSPDIEPSAAKMKEIKDFSKKNNVKVIYFEELASPKVAETLANEIGAKTEVLNTLEGLSKEDQENGFDYIKVMEKNLQTLLKYQK